MKHAIITLAILASFGAHATQPVLGGGVGLGIGIAASHAQSNASALSTAQAQGGAAAGGTASAGITGVVGGSATSYGSTSSSQGASLSLAGASLGNSSIVTNIPKQTPASYAPAGSAPLKSCRLFVGIGGAGASASLSGGLPIGNDAFCVVDNALALMDRFPGRFSDQDRLGIICKLEGMADTEGCKKSEDGKRAENILNESRPARQPMPWQAGG